MKPENSNEKLPSQQATLRLFAPDGEVYETEADFTVMRVADGDRISIEALIERDFAFNAFEVLADGLESTGRLDYMISMDEGDTLKFNVTVAM